MTESVSGIVYRITYHNTENGYTIAKLKSGKYRDLIKIAGYIPIIHVGSVLTLSGNWVTDSKFGRQFKVSGSEETIPSDINGIERYLGSGMIKGLGPKYAHRIVSCFGTMTLKVIEENPELLKKVPGLNKKIIQNIRDAWEEQRTVKEIIDFLKDININTIYATEIYKHYGKESVTVLRDNPYRMVDDIEGIGFRSADTAALKIGIDRESYIRCRAGVLYTLNYLSNKGHCFINIEQLAEYGSRLLDIDEGKLIITAGHMKHMEEVISNDNFASIYLPSLYYSEIGTAKRINEIISSSGTKKVKYNESLLKLTYGDIQKEAIKLSSEAKFMVLTGGPGTGKTTTINGIIQIFSKSGLKVILTAPTGRAAKRMAETTGLEAKTIHRLLEYNKSGKYQKNEKNQLKGDAIIIDESSMIDIVLMYNLLKAIPNSMRVVMVGDKDQLPSVGPGNVLKDIIESNVVPVVTLNKVYRQASKSDIIKNAHLINKGICPYIPKKQQGNFFFIEEKCTENISEIIRKLVLERLPKFYHVSPMNDIFVLSPVLNGEAGVNNLNNILQKALNRNKIGIKYKGIDYKLGDRVMQVRNNYDKEIYNGDIGRISNIDFNNRTIKVLFDNKETIYKMNELSELVPAYAMTVHKSQGSEFPIVVIPLIKEFKGMLQRNLLYTAITRAKNILVIVGDKDAFELSIKNDNTEKRNTKLREELKIFNNQL